MAYLKTILFLSICLYFYQYILKVEKQKKENKNERNYFVMEYGEKEYIYYQYTKEEYKKFMEDFVNKKFQNRRFQVNLNLKEFEEIKNEVIQEQRLKKLETIL